MTPDAVDGAAFAAALGSTVVVAPHPDDESIGCGGLISLLRDAALPVTVVLVSDGTQSHPGSRRWPAADRRALRVAEMDAALQALGVDTAQTPLFQLGCPDGGVPAAGEPGFEAAVQALAATLHRSRAETVLLPWRRDPHPDHRAASAIARAAAPPDDPPRLLEYGVWLDERGAGADRPRVDEARAIRIDIGDVAVARKLRALDCHASQHGRVIEDDPDGFTLPPSLCARCGEAVETYYECR